MKTKTLTCGIRIEDNRSINCGVSIVNQNNPMYILHYNIQRNEFAYLCRYDTKDNEFFYMDDVSESITALADIITAMAEANEFVGNG